MGSKTVYYYLTSSGENPVRAFIDSLEEKQQVKIFRIFQYYEEYGLEAILPHTKKLTGTPLWEIRILGRDNIRILYVSVTKNSIVVFHGFIKKTQKTEAKEINVAVKRYKDWQQRDTA